MIQPPASEEELFDRARQLAGRRLSDIARDCATPLPDRPGRAKGWSGVLLETALGATAASRPEPDFQGLGVEMKSVPVDPRGKPRESTYICTVPVPGTGSPNWEESNVRRKLARVLWVPIVGAPGTAPADRCVGAPLLWSPSAAEEAALRADWEELMDLVCLGRVDEISARHGTCLQIRPKAANAAVRQRSVGTDGAPAQRLPRGFYLRASFTGRLFARHFARAD